MIAGGAMVLRRFASMWPITTGSRSRSTSSSSSLGVFVGIQASNWNQARLDRQQAREYRADAADDLDANLQISRCASAIISWVRDEALKTLADARAALSQPRRAIPCRCLSSDARFCLGRSSATPTMRSSPSARWPTSATPLLRDKIANYYVTSDVTGANISRRAALSRHRPADHALCGAAGDPRALQRTDRSRTAADRRISCLPTRLDASSAWTTLRASGRCSGPRFAGPCARPQPPARRSRSKAA